MTQAFRHWLPASAAMPARGRHAVAAMAEEWARAWFAPPGWRAAEAFVRVADPRPELARGSWHRCDAGLAIGLARTGTAGLGAAALGLPLEAARPRADVALMERVGEACLDDLKQRSARLFGISGGWSVADGASGTVHRLEIAAPARALVVTLQLSAELFARFAKDALAAPARAALGTAAAALAGVPLQLSAELGPCSLTVAEVAGLAEGDVLVLDRALDASLPLAVGGVRLARGNCTVAHRADGLALMIAEAPIG